MGDLPDFHPSCQEEAPRAVQVLRCCFELRIAAATVRINSKTKGKFQDILGQVFQSWCFSLPCFVEHIVGCEITCVSCKPCTHSMRLIPQRSPLVFIVADNLVATESCYTSCSPQCIDILLLQRFKNGE